MRLIDADNLIKEINKLLKSPYANQSQFGAERRETIETVRDLCVKQEPTAFDVEKVVSEIKRCSGNGYRDIDGDYVPPMIRTEYAINIVKKGGIPAAGQDGETQ